MLTDLENVSISLAPCTEPYMESHSVNARQRRGMRSSQLLTWCLILGLQEESQRPPNFYKDGDGSNSFKTDPEMPISEEESPPDSSSFEMQILSQDPNFSVNNSEILPTRGYRRRSKFLMLPL